MALVFSLCMVFQPILWAQPLPTNPEVQHGEVDISTTGQNMNVDQASQYGIVDWESFGIDAGYGVNFNNGAGSTLNRVTGVDVSNIYGNLSATGNLYLLNSNGVIIGESGKVLTGGDFVASTLHISNADFLSGGDLSLSGASTAGVTNLGVISSTGGNVLLAGYSVANQGDISAAEGSAGLVAGPQIDILTDLSWANGRYAVSLGERDNSVTNEGRIEAMVAELRTHNGNIYALAGNNEGLIQATGLSNEGGVVRLTAENGLVQSSGAIIAQRIHNNGEVNGGDIEIDAEGVENYGGIQDVSGDQGGNITITTNRIITDTQMLAQGSNGDGGVITINAAEELLMTASGNISVDGSANGGEVALNSGSGDLILSGNIYSRGVLQGGRTSLWGNAISMLGGSIIADGGPLGGEIYIGGGYQGAAIWQDTPALFDVVNSQSTYISETSVLSADAGLLGRGGTVVAWSDGTTQFAGQINARGGIEGGDGGLVETSGLEGLGVSGLVDTSARAAYGVDGNWLLDPKNIIIDSITDPITQFQTLVGNLDGAGLVANTNETGGARFGQVLDISGDTIVVGAGNTVARSAYVYENGQIAARLQGDLGISGFGTSVAVEGDIIAITNPSDINQPNPGNVFLQQSGSVHIFARGSGWQNGNVNQTAKVYNPFLIDQLNNPFGFGTFQFGAEVELTTGPFGALSVVLSAPDFDNTFTNLSNSGAVFVGNVSSAGQLSGLNIIESASPTANARFGSTFSTANGLIYTADGSNLRIRDIRGFANYDFAVAMGSLFAATGNRLYGNSGGSQVSFADFEVVGAVPSVSNGTVQMTSGLQTINLNVGPLANGVRAVAASGDTLVLGNANANGNTGAVAFYVEPTGGWPSSTTVAPQLAFAGPNASSTGQGALFGTAIAVDGNTAIVGAPGAEPAFPVASPSADTGEVRIYSRTNGLWGQFPNTTLGPAAADTAIDFGRDVAIDGTTTIVSAPGYGFQFETDNRGAVFVYENDTLAAVLNDSDSSSRFFGQDIDISNNTIAAINSVSGTSRLSVFERGSGWNNGTGNRVATTVANNSQFNYGAVAIDNNTLALGLRSNLGSNNSIRVFENTSNNWATALSLGTDLTAPSNAQGLANSLDISGNSIVGLFNDLGSTGVRTATVFENTTNDWSAAVRTDLINPLSGIVNQVNQFEVAISGNTIALSGDGNGFGQESVYIYERSTDWASASTHVAQLTAPDNSVGDFGRNIALDGDLLVVNGRISGTGNQLAFFERQSGWQDGAANLISTFLLPSASGTFGTAIDISGNQLVADTNTSLTAFRLDGGDGGFDISSLNTFSSNVGDTRNISPLSLTRSLSLGTDISLQANNDITVRSAIIANNSNGDGGDLSLQAGRSILLLDSIDTDNGDLTLIANDPRATQSERDAGEGVVVLGRDTLNASVNLTLGTGNLLINAGDRFENRSGDNSPFNFDASNPGNWLIFAPTPDLTAGLSAAEITALDVPNLASNLDLSGRDFLQYNTIFDVDDPTPSGLPSGSGFIYAVQPTLEVNVADESITYGDALNSNLSLAGVSLNGAAADAATFGIGAVDLPNLVEANLASGITTSAGGFANAGTYIDGIEASAIASPTSGSLFGVGIAVGDAGDLTVAQATLTVTPDDVSRDYGSANPVFNLSYTGFVTGDSAAVLDTPVAVTTAALDNSAVGTYVLSSTGGTDNNYILDTSVTGTLTVDPLDLIISGLSGVDRVYDAGVDASLSGIASVSALFGDEVSVSGQLTASASFADKNVGDDKNITVTGLGLTGSDAGNYNLLAPTGISADISAASIAIEGLSAVDRIYDATNAVSLSGTASLTALGSDDLNIDGIAVGAFADKNVGTDKAVTLSGLNLGGADATNYVLASSGLTASITPLDINVSGLAGVDRIYDATTVAALTGTASVNALAGDSVIVTGSATGTFADKNAETDKVIGVNGLALSGTDSGNYNLIQPTGLTADISRASVQVTGVSANDREYDGTTNASLSGTASVAALAEDELSLIGSIDPLAVQFTDKNVGDDKAVSVTAFVLDGADAANYDLVQPTGLTASISARLISVSGLLIDKVYDATTNIVALGTAVYTGVVAGDNAVIDGSAAVFSFADKNVGTDKQVDASGITISGADAANYDVSQVTGLNGEISAAALTLSGVEAADRVYDATNIASVSGGTLQGLFSGDTVNLDTSAVSGSFADENVGDDRLVAISGYGLSGIDAGNYVVQQPNGVVASITPFALDVLNLNGDKIYDGNTTADLTHNGLNSFAGDDVELDASAVTAAYEDKNAGIGKIINLAGSYGLSGTDAANYIVNQIASITGDIAQLGITVDGLTIADKEYDGTTAGTVAGTGTFGGAIAGDDLQIDVDALSIAFVDKNVGEDKSVALSGVQLTGADAANYTTVAPTGISASITARDVLVEGITALDRVYDLTTAAVLTGVGSLNGIISGDDVQLDDTNLSGTFSDKNVAIDKGVSITGLGLTGVDATNYQLVEPTGLSADITLADVFLQGLTANNRVYDTTTNAVLSGTAELDFGVLNGPNTSSEDLSLAAVIGAFADKNVGEDKNVSLTTTGLSGADASNYRLIVPTNLVADITPAPIVVENTLIQSRTYDGTVEASFASLGNVQGLGADLLILNGSAALASFADKNAGEDKAVSINGFTLDGADAANYELIQPNALVASIARADLLVSGLVADDRVYDGTTAAPLSGSLNSNAIAGDDISFGGQLTASFEDKNVGEDKAIDLTGVLLEGADAANYLVILPELFASISQRVVSLLGISAEDKIYDGSEDAALSGVALLGNSIESDDIGFDLGAISASFASANAGEDLQVTLVGDALVGTDANNYSQQLPSDLSASIAPKALEITGVSAEDREYDGTANVQLDGGSLEGIVGDDDINLDTSGAQGTLANANVGNDLAVTASGYELTGADIGNYQIEQQPQGLMADISARLLSILGVEVADKFFDGTTDAVVSGGTLDNFISGDDVSLTANDLRAVFEDAIAGNDKNVRVTGFELEGGAAGNYLIDSSLNVSGNILAEIIITEIIPAEVLRASAETALEEQRQEFVAQAEAQENALVIEESYEALIDQAYSLGNGVNFAEPNNAILTLPADQQTVIEQEYISAFNENQQLVSNIKSAYGQIYNGAKQVKALEQQYNQAVRDIEVENNLAAGYQQEITRVAEALATVDQRLADINESKRRVAEFTALIESSVRLGRAAEVEEYQQVIDDANAVIALEAETLAEKSRIDALYAESEQRLSDSRSRVDELTKALPGISEEIENIAARIDQQKADLERNTEAQAAAQNRLEQTIESGRAELVSRLENVNEFRASKEQEATNLQNIANSDIPLRVATQQAANDPVVANAEAKAAQSRELAGSILGDMVRNHEGSATVYAMQLAAQVADGEGLDGPDQMRDELVSRVPELRQAQADYEAMQLEAASGDIAQASALFNLPVSGGLRNIFDGLGVDLSDVPITDASGRVLPLAERISIFMINQTLDAAVDQQMQSINLAIQREELSGSDSPSDLMTVAFIDASLGGTDPFGGLVIGSPEADAFIAERNRLALDYKDRMGGAVAAEIGFSPDQALDDPSVVVKEVSERIPFDNGSLDREQLAENLKDGASAYMNLRGLAKDQAMALAADEDPTGTLNAINSVETAARDAFVEEHGMQPEEMFLDVAVNQRIDRYKNVSSPEELAAVYLEDTGIQQNIESAQILFDGLQNGDSPAEIFENLSAAQQGDRPTQAEMAETANLMREAAIGAAVEADPTGLFGAANNVQNAGMEAFSDAFGSSPEELALESISDPTAAVSRAADLASDFATNPVGMMGEGFSGAIDVGMATFESLATELADPEQFLTNAGEAIGGAIGDTAEALCFWCSSDDGPSDAELAAQAQRRQIELVGQVMDLAQRMAANRMQSASTLTEIKTSVGQFVAAEVKARNDALVAEVHKEIAIEQYAESMTADLESRASLAQRDAADADPVNLQAQAERWGI